MACTFGFSVSCVFVVLVLVVTVAGAELQLIDFEYLLHQTSKRSGCLQGDKLPVDKPLT